MMLTDELVRDVRVAAYTVPTDQPEADGTLAWDSTTLVVVTVTAGTTKGTGWTYGPAACAARRVRPPRTRHHRTSSSRCRRVLAGHGPCRP